jgi:hypothetical protein
VATAIAINANVFGLGRGRWAIGSVNNLVAHHKPMFVNGLGGQTNGDAIATFQRLTEINIGMDNRYH